MAESTGSNQVDVGGQSGDSGYNPSPYSSRDLNGSAYDQAKRSVADTYAQAQRAASDWTQQTRSATETYVRDKPWNAVGIAAAIGFLVGLILRR